MTIVNLTPHAVKVLVSGNPDEGDAEWRVFHPSGDIARVTTENDCLGTIDGDIPIFATEFKDITGVPEPEQGTFLIVSRVVLAACESRGDLLVPHDLIRNSAGQVVGCRGFSR